MLEEIQAANKAMGTILTAIKHGRELSQCADSCATYFNCKSILARRSNKKGRGNALANFMELEKLREKEQQLKEIMIYLGRPGLWDDWLKFQSLAKKERVAQEKKRKQQEAATMTQVMYWFKWMAGGIAGTMSMLVAVMDFINTARS